jgi:hypothetical protein
MHILAFRAFPVAQLHTKHSPPIMKSSPLSLLFAATAYASPLLSERQSTCPTSGISASRAAAVRSAFQQSGIITDVVPDLTPTTELSVKYGNINENLGNEFTVLRTQPFGTKDSHSRTFPI